MKKFIKLCIPPILFGTLNRIRQKIYRSISSILPEYSAEIKLKYSDLNVIDNNLWDSPNWFLYESSKLNKFADNPHIHQQSVIKSCRILNKVNGYKKIHIIDFGGGCGTLANQLFNALSFEKFQLEVSVIDSPTIIKLGADFFSDSRNIKFFEQENADMRKISDRFKSKKFATILNISSVLQYIPNYKEFLANLLEQTQPLFVTITRFPRCENVNIDAFAIQNVTTHLGFCGSTIVNLFGTNSLTDYMKSLGYDMLFEDFNEINDTAYFDKCDDEQYRNITLVAYIFVKNIS